MQYGAVFTAIGAALLFTIALGGRRKPPGPYFYVHAASEYGVAALVTGPYASRQDATSDVQRVRDHTTAIGAIPAATTLAWGVSEIPRRCTGMANNIIGFIPPV